MADKVVSFIKDKNIYLKLADKKTEEGDLAGALGFLFNARAIKDSPETLMNIADIYSQMGVLDLSNKYWFYYLDKVPKNCGTTAYEELAINYFYMDDYLSSSYYFHQKLTFDGFLSKDNLDPEIMEFFSGEEFKKCAYHIAYPFDRADYSYAFKRAKRALSIGNFKEAISILSAVPKECLKEEPAGDLAVAYLMMDNTDEAASVCRNSLANDGDNVTALCNLSTIYDMKEDFEKSEYYYKRALECAKGDKNEEYKLATCAIERKDHKVVKSCLEKILIERPYDITMRFFYALSLYNLGEFEQAEKELSYAYRLDPTDPILKYFIKYVSTSASIQNYMPFKYLKVLPERLVKSNIKAIGELLAKPEKMNIAVKKQEVQDLLEWGLYSSDSEVVRKCVYALSISFGPYAKATLLDVLKNNEAETAVKRIVLYALVVNGYKQRFTVVDKNFIFKIKPKKLSFEDDKGAGVYISAYGLCLSRMAFLGIDNLGKIADAIEKVYKKFSKLIRNSELTNEEISAVVLFVCKYPRFSEDFEIRRIFEVEKDRLKTLKKIYLGDEND